MTDRKLLELAAKAAGIEIATWSNCNAGGFISVGEPYLDSWGDERTNGKFWNPLTDDGDALRLAVKLELTVLVGMAQDGEGNITVDKNDDPYAATRRAIVRAAAEIGKEIK